jgi:hypothetical protein
MVKEEIVNKICTARGMQKMSISTVATWIDKGTQEGIELSLGKLKPFWVINGVRDYNEPTGDKILQTIKLIMVEDIGKKDVEPEKVNAEKVEGEIYLINDLPQIINNERVIAFSELEEFKKRYPKVLDRMLLFQKTPPRLIKVKKGRGGKPQHYVEGNTMKFEAWLAFLGKMSVFTDGWEKDVNGVTCYGHITYPDDDNYIITSSGIGTDLQEYSKDDKTKAIFTTHELMKNAHTDMVKKALANIEFNRDVYSGEYD